MFVPLRTSSVQGDKAVQLNVLRLVDHTHTAAAELLDDAVVRDGLANQFKKASLVGSR
jgi:hypothetical protein